jgi:hypothetical protein
MSFSQSVVEQALERSKGRCECTEPDHNHAGVRCSVFIDPDNKLPGLKWQATYVADMPREDRDRLSNCEILCLPCSQ